MKTLANGGCMAACMFFVLGLTTSVQAQVDCTNPDQDGDGFDAIACGGSDCDDSDSNRFPGNVEICDPVGIDEDCDFSTPGIQDIDGDGYIAERCRNQFPDGTVASQGQDCDDTRASISPMASEVCDGVDNNCDGDVDSETFIELFVDNDLDGHGDPLDLMRACPGTAGLSTLPNDCDDANPAIEPGDQVCVPGRRRELQICGSDGEWLAGSCPRGTVCQSQLNGTGLCVDRQRRNREDDDDSS